MAGQARQRFEKLGIWFEAGRSIVNSAIARYQKGELAGALDLFAKADDIFKREGETGDQSSVGWPLLRAGAFGRAATRNGLCPSVLSQFYFFVAARLRRREVLCRCYWRAWPFEPSIPGCASAARDRARDPESIEAPLLSYHAHLIMGDLRREIGDGAPKLQVVPEGAAQIEGLRASLQGEELKIAFMKNRVEIDTNGW